MCSGQTYEKPIFNGLSMFTSELIWPQDEHKLRFEHLVTGGSRLIVGNLPLKLCSYNLMEICQCQSLNSPWFDTSLLHNSKYEEWQMKRCWVMYIKKWKSKKFQFNLRRNIFTLSAGVGNNKVKMQGGHRSWIVALSSVFIWQRSWLSFPKYHTG